MEGSQTAVEDKVEICVPPKPFVRVAAEVGFLAESGQVGHQKMAGPGVIESRQGCGNVAGGGGGSRLHAFGRAVSALDPIYGVICPAPKCDPRIGGSWQDSVVHHADIIGDLGLQVGDLPGNAGGSEIFVTRPGCRGAPGEISGGGVGTGVGPQINRG